MVRSLKAALLGCAIAISLGFGNAHAQQAPACLPMAAFERQAVDEYKEMPVAFGPTSSGWTMTVWASEGGATWTIAAISPDGKTACVLDDGRDWNSSAVSAPKGKGA